MEFNVQQSTYLIEKCHQFAAKMHQIDESTKRNPQRACKRQCYAHLPSKMVCGREKKFSILHKKFF